MPMLPFSLSALFRREDVAHMRLDREGVQIPLHCVGSGRWNASAALSLLTIEDAFTGWGAVQKGKPG
jgi:hypothetical protein